MTGGEAGVFHGGILRLALYLARAAEDQLIFILLDSNKESPTELNQHCLFMGKQEKDNNIPRKVDKGNCEATLATSDGPRLLPMASQGALKEKRCPHLQESLVQAGLVSLNASRSSQALKAFFAIAES